MGITHQHATHKGWRYRGRDNRGQGRPHHSWEPGCRDARTTIGNLVAGTPAPLLGTHGGRSRLYASEPESNGGQSPPYVGESESNGGRSRPYAGGYFGQTCRPPRYVALTRTPEISSGGM